MNTKTKHLLENSYGSYTLSDKPVTHSEGIPYCAYILVIMSSV